MDKNKTVDVTQEKGKGCLKPQAESVGPICIPIDTIEEKKEDGD